MTAKEYLLQIRKNDISINQLIKEVDDLRSQTVFISGIDYSKDRVQTSTDGTPGVLKSIEKLYDTEKMIDRAIDRYIGQKHKIIMEIQGLDKAEYIEILHKRYIEYDKGQKNLPMKSFEQIACEMNISYVWATHLHGHALKAFQEKYLEK